MSGHFFPIKLACLFSALEKTGALSALAHCGSGTLTYPDSRIRLRLCSPEVHEAVKASGDGKGGFKRLAVPKELTIGELCKNAHFELYGTDGNLVEEPVLLTDLSDALANAIQVELIAELLKAKGIGYPECRMVPLCII